jgi:hypothetical protein
VLAVAAAGWDRVRQELGPQRSGQLAAELRAMRSSAPGSTRQEAAVRRAAAAVTAAVAGPAADPGRLVAVAGPAPAGFTAADLAVLVLDGHAMVGPVLGVVRERVLAEPALTETEARRRGVGPGATDLIRVPRDGGFLLPRFQFAPAAGPLPAVLAVNSVLGADRDPWGVADWWLSPDAWLAGARPVAVLRESGGPARVLEAARCLVEAE